MSMNVQSATPFFLAGLHDDATRKEIQASRFWPIIVAAINQVKDPDDSLVVGPIERFTLTKSLKSVDLVTRAGLRVCAVYRDDEDPDGCIAFGGINEPHRLGGPWSCMHVAVASKNVKYIVRKIKYQDSDPYYAIHNRWRDTKQFLSYQLNCMMERAVRSNGVMPENINIPGYAATALVKAYMGEINKIDIPQHIVTQIETQYREYVNKKEKAKDCVSNLRQMLNNDKWVMLSDMDGAVIVGAISKRNLQAALDSYELSGEIPDHNKFTYIDAIVPFKRYPSFDAIEDDIRRDIEMQLTMLKIHTNSDKPPLLTANDTERGHRVYADIGVMVSSDYSRSPVVVVDKTV
jgi:hypothetical protein